MYKVEDARDFLTAAGLDMGKIAREVDGKFISAFVRPKSRPLEAPLSGRAAGHKKWT